MRVKEIPRTVYDRVYVAKDGREFKTMEECEEYEISIDDILKRKKEVEEAVEKFEIKDMEGSCWIRTDRSFVSEYSSFKWYKLNRVEDFELLDEFYDYELEIDMKINYPEIICVEEWDDEYYGCLVSEMIKDVKDYFKDLGYKVTFEKE